MGEGKFFSRYSVHDCLQKFVAFCKQPLSLLAVVSSLADYSGKGI